MAYDLATVTNSGNQLLASVISDKSSLVIDKIEVSNTQLASSTDLKSMTSISNVVQTLSANGYQKKDNSFIISTVLDNSSVDTDYKAWVFGIWAHKSDGGSSILMSVITSTSSPDTISKSIGTPIDYNYKFITTFSNTSSLKIQMASDTYATNETVIHNSGDETATGTKTFQKIKISNTKFPSLVQTDGQYITLDGGNSEIVPADNSKVVHTTGDETIDGQKKFKTDPTDGAGNAYAKTVDVNQQLDKKVIDNKNGTEQLNGVQVQPFNKLSDTIGGRNLLPGTSGTLKTVADASGYNAQLPEITPVVATIDSDTTYTARAWLSPVSHNMSVQIAWKDAQGTQHYDSGNTISAGTSGYSTWTETLTAGSTIRYVTIIFNQSQSTPSSVSYKEMKFEQGSIATDWTPAPEDKVSVSDMRKPASDVVGLEDVPQAVVHSKLTSGVDLNTFFTSGVYPFARVSFTNYVDNSTHWGYLVVTCEGLIVTQTVYATSHVQPLYRMFSGDPLSWSPWAMIADDSKVAHLSGANNFDTVPTVKNNPLLLASSLPSDLARLSHDANFTAKLQQNGQDVALANHTIYRNPDTGQATQKINFASGDLTADGYPIMAYGVATDKNDATAKSAKYPGVLFIW